MQVINERYNKAVLAMIGLLFLSCAVFIMLSGCAPQRYSYKVTFQSGDVEYFELNYKPKADAKSIEYEGETIIGVKELERLK